ncbi:MAG: hypothetical protein R2727_02000 [Bacteroidales bacterium]
MEEMNYNMAVEYCQTRDYQNAIQYLEKLVDNNDGNTIKSNFMLGVTNMKIEKYNDAIVPLEKVVNHNDNLFLEQAKVVPECLLPPMLMSIPRMQEICFRILWILKAFTKTRLKRALKKIKVATGEERIIRKQIRQIVMFKFSHQQVDRSSEIEGVKGTRGAVTASPASLAVR